MLLANHGPVPEGGTLGLAFGIMSHSFSTRVIGQGYVEFSTLLLL